MYPNMMPQMPMYVMLMPAKAPRRRYTPGYAVSAKKRCANGYGKKCRCVKKKGGSTYRRRKSNTKWTQTSNKATSGKVMYGRASRFNSQPKELTDALTQTQSVDFGSMDTSQVQKVTNLVI